MALTYNNPRKGKESSVGPQVKQAFFERRAVTAIQDEMYFSQMGGSARLPLNTGNVIEAYVEIPIIDDRNVNDQGINAEGKVIKDGNLYGSSRDIATIQGKMPVIGERPGRSNRVGLIRSMITATVHNFGIFIEFTESSRDFDSYGNFIDWVTKSLVAAAHKVHEDQLQIELLNGAAVRVYAGGATKDSEMGENHKVSYGDLSRLAVTLDNTKTPRSTKILSGSANYGTTVVNAARVMFVGTEIQQDLKRMTDYHGERAFKPLAEYASQGTAIRGEIGAIDGFRIVSIDTMMYGAGTGAAVGPDSEMHATDGKANVYPMLVVGSESFDVIQFKADGKNARFRTHVVEPGTKPDRADPFAKMGFASIQWWHGVLFRRPERIAVLKTTVGF